MKTFFFCCAIFTTIFLFGSGNVKACLCSENSTPILEYETAPIVFIGKVKSVAEDRSKIERQGEKIEIRIGLAAYFDIIEPFKGTKSKEATIVTGGGGGDCGFNFQVGETYFVFALRRGSEYAKNMISKTLSENASKPVRGDVAVTDICMLTNNLKFMNDELEMIRGFLKGKPEPRVYGTVREYARRFDGGVLDKIIGVVPNVGVVIEGEKNRFEAVTDEQGRYSVKGLTAGKYKLKFILPDAYAPRWRNSELEEDFEIEDNEDSAEIDLDAQPSGEISGILYDSGEKPVENGVRLSLIPYESINLPNPEKHSNPGFTDEDGSFVFKGIGPGKYYLGVSIAEAPDKDTPYAKTFFPSGETVADAKLIEITNGQKIRNADIKLPSELVPIVVEGYVYTTDGKPSEGARVNIYDAENPTEPLYDFSRNIKTDANGYFKITGFKNRKYLLHAHQQNNSSDGKGTQSELFAVVFDAAVKPVKLILNRGGISPERLK